VTWKKSKRQQQQGLAVLPAEITLIHFTFTSVANRLTATYKAERVFIMPHNHFTEQV
jgi:hypothetical protein